jgi:hypothetical protein
MKRSPPWASGARHVVGVLAGRWDQGNLSFTTTTGAQYTTADAGAPVVQTQQGTLRNALPFPLPFPNVTRQGKTDTGIPTDDTTAPPPPPPPPPPVVDDTGAAAPASTAVLVGVALAALAGIGIAIAGAAAVARAS